MPTWLKLLLIALPVMVAVYFHFGDRFNANTVSWTDIIGNKAVVAVSENSRKSFTLINKKGETYDIAVSQGSNISNEDLNTLLLRYGVKSDGMDKDKKISLLLKVSSPDFWRRNFGLHPKKSRVSNWLWIHARYLSRIAALKEFTDKEELKKAFIKICGKLDGHALDYEDKQMFTFFNENLKQFAIYNTFLQIVDDLEKEHIPIENKAKEIQNNWDKLSLQDIKNEINELEKPIIEHFDKEEHEITPVMLNLDNALYTKYRSYLSWKYYFMY